MGCLLTYWTGEVGFGNRAGTSEELVFDDKAEDRLEGAMVWLLRYAAKDWAPLSLAVPIPATSPKKPKRRGAKAVEAPKANQPETWVCLLCDEYKPFTRRFCLSRHNKTNHIDNGDFDQPSLCPHCTPPVEISGAIEWCDHAEKVHGKMYAPVVSSKLLAETRVSSQTKMTPTRKSTKRKREEDEILRMVVLDLLEKPQKRARTIDEEVSFMLMETLEGHDNSDYGEFHGSFLSSVESWLRHDCFAANSAPASPSSLSYASDVTLNDPGLPGDKGKGNRGWYPCNDDDEASDFVMGVGTYGGVSGEESDGMDDGE